MSLTDRHEIGGGAGSGMPAPVKYAFAGLVTALIAGGVYLWFVRGPAIFYDLSALGAQLLCF